MAAPAPKPGEVRLHKSDIPKHQRKPLLDAVSKLYAAHVTCKDDEKAKKQPLLTRLESFAQSLRGTLDKSLGPKWHVLVGKSLGFACKKRNNTMAAFRVDGMMVVCWRSPGIEHVFDEEEPPAEEAAAEKTAKKFRLVEPSEELLSKGAEGEDEEDKEKRESLQRTIDSLKAALEEEGSDEDSQKVAQAVRRRLTKDLGTIWHVAVGNEFILANAHDARNRVHASWGKLHIVCFQHEQYEGSKFDREKFLQSVPYFMLVVFLLLWIAMHNVCPDEMAAEVAQSTFKTWLKEKVCRKEWEKSVNILGGGAIVMLFITKKGASVLFRKSTRMKTD
eukprot:TRINITY_DN9152_c0_g1_i3.p1 TRINITY_DN9152_c0_g1~~TRINITY_DN9152_c0_g1_i3.p1  ORF type:complete len:333 (+),score=108.01 TRINITY_DN9152_c0_g1_i3:84-1082(+)